MSFHQLEWVFNRKTHGFVPLIGKNLPKPWVFSLSFYQLEWVFNSKTHGFVPLLGKNLPRPWVFSLSYWVFSWVLSFFHLEFFSKCPISKPGLIYHTFMKGRKGAKLQLNNRKISFSFCDHLLIRPPCYYLLSF